MTEIILARHGQTVWNVGEIFRGRSDIDLDATGVRQAELLAEYLKDRKIEAIYSSPLKRALQTAQPVAAKHNLEVIVSPGLNDFHFGEWQGLSVPEVQQKFPAIFAQWAETPHLVKIPGGESLDDVTKRAMAVVEEVIVKHKNTVVLAGHRVVSRVLMLALLGLDNSHFWNIRQDTAATTVFIYERGRFVLSEHNNTSHLRPLNVPKLKDF
jgi:broad specificity phosphatase PhoE